MSSKIFGLWSSCMLEYRWLFTLFLRSLLHWCQGKVDSAPTYLTTNFSLLCLFFKTDLKQYQIQGFELTSLPHKAIFSPQRFNIYWMSKTEPGSLDVGHMGVHFIINLYGLHIYTGVGKNRFTVVSTQNILFLYYYLLIIFHINNCKTTFAHPCIMLYIVYVSQYNFAWVEYLKSPTWAVTFCISASGNSSLQAWSSSTAAAWTGVKDSGEQRCSGDRSHA